MKDPKTVKILGRDFKVIERAPIVEILTLQGVRSFALHRDTFLTAHWTVTEIKTGAKISCASTRLKAVAKAMNTTAAAARFHGTMENAMAWAYLNIQKQKSSI